MEMEKKSAIPITCLSRWTYGVSGEHMSLTHEDGSGIPEQYSYDYDEMGNKTKIHKERAVYPGTICRMTWEVLYGYCMQQKKETAMTMMSLDRI